MQEIVREWIYELRSGHKYARCNGGLRSDNSFCAEGVLLDIAANHGVGTWQPDPLSEDDLVYRIDGTEALAWAPKRLKEVLGLPLWLTVLHLNDSDCSWPAIADYIEKVLAQPNLLEKDELDLLEVDDTFDIDQCLFKLSGLSISQAQADQSDLDDLDLADGEDFFDIESYLVKLPRLPETQAQSDLPNLDELDLPEGDNFFDIGSYLVRLLGLTASQLQPHFSG